MPLMFLSQAQTVKNEEHCTVFNGDTNKVSSDLLTEGQKYYSGGTRNHSKNRNILNTAIMYGQQ